jgi:DNA-directed RNA polymerase specialized sigma24 family protein
MFYESADELMSTVNLKLLKSLPRCHPRRGSAFSYVSRIATNMLCSQVTRNKKLANRYPPLDELTVATTPDEGSGFHSRLALDDLTEADLRNQKLVSN